MIDPLIDLPRDLLERYADWSFDEAYHHTPGRPTYRLDGVAETRFVKVLPASLERVLIDEVMRLRWAAEWLSVPELVEHGTDGELSWLMTRALPGVDASVHPWCKGDPERLATVLGAALRGLHDGVPVRECPFALPEADDGDQVVLHGDFCLPNVLLTGEVVTGFIDVGRLGIGDRWWDLAVGSASITRNCGPGHEEAFFAGYGLSPDRERVQRYREAYDALP
ncbi:kanamycin kinase [Allocatelliglobosispora scoriae]|uniref:Kanamycin kinase n=1 Tax=Allocatelliglobosispora scoriae TaxID=643052 RepID=A0A841BR83_9ACTN|nr:phosphotransferase [Allocatelliglobosispora scoriae]MBB5869320.1 kanamycin kinase [Allocatelliglobosispora scoriae]